MAGTSAYESFEDPENEGFSRVPTHLWAYANAHTDLAAAAADLRNYLEGLAVEASIQVHTIESRAKSLQSYVGKATATRDGIPKYDDPRGQIHDCVAARVMLFTTRARTDFAEILLNRTKVLSRHNPGDTKHNGYDSEHLIITGFSDQDARARHVALAKYFDEYPALEIQLRSVAAHAWAEYEHDIRYKPGAYQALSSIDRAQVDQWFMEAGGLRRFMDQLFDQIQDLLQPESDRPDTEEPSADFPDAGVELVLPEESDGRELTPETLYEVIEQRFPHDEVGDRKVVAELASHLGALAVVTVGGLESALSEIESDQVGRLMDYPTPPTGVRRLDDELLAVFTDRYVAAADDPDRAHLLRLRLRRVRGKFAIYSIDDGARVSRRPVAAARAVRQLAELVAARYGAQAAVVNDAIALEPGVLGRSAHARLVQVGDAELYVTTNLGRSWAEAIMRELLARAPGSGWRVLRAGDVLVEAPGDQPPIPE